MNIFALPQCQALKLMLLRLDEGGALDGRIAAEDGQAAQPDSLRLTDLEAPGLSAYIYTYGQGADRYGVDLEYPPQPAIPGITLEGYQEVELERLLDMLRVHFALVDSAPISTFL